MHQSSPSLNTSLIEGMERPVSSTLAWFKASAKTLDLDSNLALNFLITELVSLLT